MQLQWGILIVMITVTTKVEKWCCPLVIKNVGCIAVIVASSHHWDGEALVVDDDGWQQIATISPWRDVADVDMISLEKLPVATYWHQVLANKTSAIKGMQHFIFGHLHWPSGGFFLLKRRSTTKRWAGRKPSSLDQFHFPNLIRSYPIYLQKSDLPPIPFTISIISAYILCFHICMGRNSLQHKDLTKGCDWYPYLTDEG